MQQGYNLPLVEYNPEVDFHSLDDPSSGHFHCDQCCRYLKLPPHKYIRTLDWPSDQADWLPDYPYDMTYWYCFSCTRNADEMVMKNDK